MNSEDATEEQKKEMEEKCTKLFQNGVEARTASIIFVDKTRCFCSFL